MTGQDTPPSRWNRREVLRMGAATGIGGILTPPLAAIHKKNRDYTGKRIRMGFVGVGLQGSSHVKNFLRIPGVEIVAVCDIVEEKVHRIQGWVEKAGGPRPRGFWRGERDFERMCDEVEMDLVFTATPWKWHVPVCLKAMATGSHAATEVPAALTVDECWQLVEASERTGLHCVMMENCCYSRSMLMVLRMVRQGVLGEIINGGAGYMHDLRALKFNGRNEALWRTDHSIRRDGNLYPTHGLGPVAQCMDINRGDRFDYLVSMSSVSRGLNLYAAKKFGPDSPEAEREYALGDVNTSLIRTRKGRTITLWHDTSSPRPYSRVDLVQGTKGIYKGFPPRIYIEGRNEKHAYADLHELAGEYEHPLWAALREKAIGAGHGGMDYIEDYRLVRALQTGTEPDMDVYDAAAWSVVSELTERSVAGRSRAVDFPDFTRGRWRERRPLGIIQPG